MPGQNPSCATSKPWELGQVAEQFCDSVSPSVNVDNNSTCAQSRAEHTRASLSQVR